jgi:hypothetical protein
MNTEPAAAPTTESLLLLQAVSAMLGVNPSTVEMEFTGDKDETSYCFTAPGGRCVGVTFTYWNGG